MLKIAICEDKHELVSTLKEYLARYQEEKGVEFEAQAFAKGSAFLAKQHKFDLVIMDTELQDESGIETAQKLREVNLTMPLVFVASSKQFTIKGYEVDAVDFLAAPIGYYEFETMLDRLQTRLVKMDVPSIAVMTKQGARRIFVDQIEYLDGSMHHVVYHLTDGEVRVRGTLNEEAKKLTPDRFFRLGGYIVNLARVNKVWENDIYIGSMCLPVPYKQKAELLSGILACMNRG
ncbi:MAG: response regulator transcription factor [Clostridia bacterium]|nr:response regulator transcription factor [Clostridia bacterium]